MAGDPRRNRGEQAYKEGARRSFGLVFMIFPGLLLVEGLSHLGSASPSATLIPLVGALALTAVRMRSKSDPRILRHADFWLLFPWAAAMATILTHLPRQPMLTLLFVSMMAVIVGAMILSKVPFAIALPLTLAAQIVCLYSMPAVPSSALFITPLTAGRWRF